MMRTALFLAEESTTFCWLDISYSFDHSFLANEKQYNANLRKNIDHNFNGIICIFVVVFKSNMNLLHCRINKTKWLSFVSSKMISFVKSHLISNHFSYFAEQRSTNELYICLMLEIQRSNA